MDNGLYGDSSDHVNKRLRRLRRLSTVPRWTVVPTIHKQNVAEHTFHVVYMTMWVGQWHAGMRDGSISVKDLVTGAILHDEDEGVYGDFPSPAKKYIHNSALEDLKNSLGIGECDPAVKKIIKVVDILEALIFIEEEELLGNRCVYGIKTDLTTKFITAWGEFDYHGNDKPKWSDFLSMAIAAFDPRIHPILEQT